MIDRYADRRARLAAAALAEGLDGLIVAGASNLRYLTGFTGSAGHLVVTAGGTTLLTDFRYAVQGPAEVGPGVTVRIERASLWKGLRGLVGGSGLRRVGIDRHRVTLADLDELQQLEGVELVPGAGRVEALRMVKDADETARIREAARLASEALAAVIGGIRPGRREIDVAAELEAALRVRGSEWHPFHTIVASGPRSALPHAQSTSRVIGAGDLLVVDFGAQLDGYCSDITRTFVVGAAADGRQREVYSIVEQAQHRARRLMRAGMTGREIDALARDPITTAGMGEAFGHSLGHGVGLEVHEEPRLAKTSETVIPPGAVVTVEPGVYFEGWGGVRIEDDVAVTAGGAECLSDGRTELIELT
ncbi:MAG: aminopeptidase P family protein [Gemmatimonadales bacterium]|nr:aminopeptidase P family protein [Gemmatimonadales bacterium]